jgi:hypothetical protein
MSTNLQPWVVAVVVLCLALVTPIVAQWVWRRIRPTSTISLYRYAPHLAFLLIIWVEIYRQSRTGWSLAEGYAVALLIWIASITTLSALRAHSPSGPVRRK